MVIIIITSVVFHDKYRSVVDYFFLSKVNVYRVTYLIDNDCRKATNFTYKVL